MTEPLPTSRHEARREQSTDGAGLTTTLETPPPAAKSVRGGGLRLRTFSSLRHRDYRLLWFSTLFSSTGQWMENIALSWLVWQLTGSPLLLGAVNGVRALPFFLSPLAGVAADRVDRKKLMLVTQVAVVVLSFSMAALVFFDVVEVWHVFVFTLLLGFSWTFNQPVRQAILPGLVPREELMNAVALQSTAFNITRLIGPMVAGILIALVGVEGAFAAKGFAYIGVTALILMMRVPPASGRAREASVRQNLVEGLRYVARNPTVLSLIAIAMIPVLFVMPYVMSLMPIFADEVYGIGPEGLGLLMSTLGVGALAGTLTVASLGNFRHRGLLLLGSGVAMGLMLTLFGLSKWLPLTLVVLVGLGFPQMAFMSLNMTLLQMSISDEIRGRVMSVYMLDRALVPLGSLLAGAVANYWGAPTAVVVGGSIATAAAAAAFVFLPRIRNWQETDPQAVVGGTRSLAL